jgi:trimeric autotransporter adhesin
MNKIILSFIFLLFTATIVNAQSLAINNDGSTANPSSILDVKSTTKGILIPRMSKVEKNAIAAPANGLLIYQNAPDSVGFHFYNGSAWVWLQNSNEGWSLNGNNSITASNFLGTINNAALKFKVFNQPAGIVDSTTGDAALGFGALGTVHSGPGFYANSALGFGAGKNLNSGYGNVAIGRDALARTSASLQNVAIGDSAMGNAASSYGVIGIGYHALKNSFGNNTYTYNVAIGHLSQSAAVPLTAPFSYFNTSIGGYAMAENITGNTNIGIGVSALRNNLSSSNHIAIGYNALTNHLTNNNNVAVGNRALENDTSGFFNVAIGSEALLNEKNSESNMAIGFRSLKSLVNGFANTAIGVGAMEYKDSALECTAIGRFAMAGQPGVSIKKDTGSVAIGTWAGRFNNASYNTFLGYYAGTGITDNITGGQNVGVGSYSLTNIFGGIRNTAIGVEAGDVTVNGNRNIFIGYQSGNNANVNGSNKLYIESSNADSTAALIYGDFSADSLLLNAKTIIRDKLGIKGAAGNTGIELGYGIAGKEINAGRIGYSLFTPNAIDFVGGGTTITPRLIKFWAEGGSTFTGKIIPDADNAYSLGQSGNRWSTVWAASGVVSTSDANLKTNITPSPYGLQQVMQMKPVQYNWKTNPGNDLQIGFLAQDIQKIIPEAVVVPTNGDPMGMKYSELIPVLAKAIQELKNENETQKKRIEILEQKLKK